MRVALVLGVAAALRCPARRPLAVHRRSVAALGAPRETDSEGGGVETLAPDAAVATLGLVTALWGSQHAVTKLALSSGDDLAASLTALRFFVAAAATAPFFPDDAATRAAGAELGLWAFLGFAFQTVGLETTTATRSAFLLYLNVKFVPLLEVAGKKPLPRGTWPSAACALLGTGLLASDAGGLDGGPAWVVGDSWSVLAALASACFIVRLDRYANLDAAPLTAASAAATGALAALWLCASGGLDGGAPPTAEVCGAALYLGLVPSALCGFLQARAQRSVPPARAAVVYATDPLWAAAFAYAALGERLGPNGLAGAAAIAAAAFGQRLLLREDAGDGGATVD